MKNRQLQNNQTNNTEKVSTLSTQKLEMSPEENVYYAQKKEKHYFEATKKFEKIDKSNYKSYVYEKSPKSSHLKNMFWAFLVGGLICCIGQGFIEIYKSLNFDTKEASVLSSSTLVILTALFTGFGIYDLLGRFAGAGSTIPITGFSNAVVAPALEFRSEGMIYGLGAKMFLIAGPVIVNGVAISVLIALLRLLITGGN